jgi:hypothetical protein
MTASLAWVLLNTVFTTSNRAKEMAVRPPT